MTSLPMLLTTEEVAEVLRVHIGTVTKWVRQGRLAAVTLPGGTYRFHRADIERLLSGERHTDAASPEAVAS